MTRKEQNPGYGPLFPLHRLTAGCRREGPRPHLVAWLLFVLALFPLTPQLTHAEGQGTSEVRLPPFILSGQNEDFLTEVYDVVSLRLADLVIVSSGYSEGYRPGMLCIVLRDETPVAEILLVEVRDDISAAIIREMIPGQIIQPGDAVQIKTVHF